MRYSIVVKFIAVTICTLMLLCSICSALCLAALGATGMLSGKTIDELRLENAEEYLRLYAAEAVSIWAAGEYGEMPEELCNARMASCQSTYFQDGDVFLTISDTDGTELFSNFHGEHFTWNREFSLSNVRYQHYIGAEDTDAESENDSLVKYKTGFWSESDDTFYEYYYIRENIQEIKASIYLNANALQDDPNFIILGKFAQHQGLLLCTMVGGLFLFAAFAVFLCCAAGRQPGTDEIKADGLNKFPLDLYAAGLLGVFLLNMLIIDKIDYPLIQIDAEAFLLAICACGFFCCLSFVGFCFAFVAQLKMPNYYYLKNTLCIRCILLAGKCIRYLFGQIPKLYILLRGCYRLFLRLLLDAKKVILAIVHLCLDVINRIWKQIYSILCRIGKYVEHYFSLLPILWQWLLIGCILLFWLLLAVKARDEEGFIAWGIAALILVLYGSNSFGALLEAAKKMRGGDLNSKVEDKYMIGCFRQFAEELNGLANVAVTAAQNQMKSERMKTELITNVSHDIKTPLTSIINYVDLLKMPHTREQESNYLEVLQRQSSRMKKLIDDLMELSKASTGNINVEIAQIDAAEAVNQALGEFTDKLASVGLTAVFEPPAESITLLADGRLLWRCMSNILSNAVKYSLPGTRLYVDVSATEQQAMITFKNISGTQLNISADELTERFVRGDSSRNTEGSGLGLNIAKSLMELQSGQLELLVDGDLFKASLVFPRA